MKLRIRIFEGPDCCGKTTQAEMFVKNYRNSILFHFPIFEDLGNDKDEFTTNPKINPKLAIKNLNNNLYNDKLTEDDLKAKHDEIATDIKNNIESNAYNKLKFLEFLENFFDKRRSNKYIIDSMNACHFGNCIKYLKLNWETIENSNYINALIDFRKRAVLEDSDETDLYIVFDRFFLSGRIYNYNAVSDIYKYKYKPIFYDIVSENIKKFETLYETGEEELLRKLIKIVVNYNDFRDWQIIAKHNKVSSKDDAKALNWFYNSGKILPTAIQTYIFLPSEILYRKSLETRRIFDEYDSNTMLRTAVNKAYLRCCLTKLPHIYDTINLTYPQQISSITPINCTYRHNYVVIDTDKIIQIFGNDNEKSINHIQDYVRKNSSNEILDTIKLSF